MAHLLDINPNYANYVITPITEAIFFKEKSELRQLRNYTNYAVTKMPKPPTCLAISIIAALCWMVRAMMNMTIFDEHGRTHRGI